MPMVAHGVLVYMSKATALALALAPAVVSLATMYGSSGESISSIERSIGMVQTKFDQTCAVRHESMMALFAVNKCIVT